MWPAMVAGRSQGALRRLLRGMLVLAAIAGALLALPAGASASTWGWSSSSIAFVRDQGIVPSTTLAAGPSGTMTRRAWVRSLVALEAYRHARYGTPARYPTVTTGAVLSDVERSSMYAKAVALGWISPIDGAFAGNRPISADEASHGVIAAMGMHSSTRAFARRLRENAPGLSTRFVLRAAQVNSRVLRMRYNHPTGSEAYEVGPTQGMRIAHAAYMLHHGATADAWRVSSLRTNEGFDIPDLGANQRRVIYTGLRLVGQPYVWGGETEGSQAEGHGGFDCSGFVWRTVMGSGVPAANLVELTARTSQGMSDIPRARRIYRIASLRPGDVLFWGDAGAASTPAQNFHAGVYMGNGWFVHSSGSNDGVTISRLEGYWRDRFSWGRRVLLAS